MIAGPFARQRAGGPDDSASGHDAQSADAAADVNRSELFDWVEQACAGRIVRTVQIAGGNRRNSWAIDVADSKGQVTEAFLRHAPAANAGAEPYTIEREARVYRAIAHVPVAAPRIIAENPGLRALLTSRAPGIAEFRHLTDAAVKQTIAREFIENLARLHGTDASRISIDGGERGTRISDHVRTELATWRAMYVETERPDPLIDIAFRWLEHNQPDPDGRVVLNHGDAGPGNFLFADGHLTALIDWEFGHLGDPLDDLAWFSMRCVMEPVPDFAACLTYYEQLARIPIDRARLLYYRVLVSTRVVVVRHRNVTGEPANAIVSGALNRRLLVEALAAASGISVEFPPSIDRPATSRTPLYDHVLEHLKRIIDTRGTEGQTIASAKSSAKVVKFLQASDRYGDALVAADLEAISRLLGHMPQSIETGREAVARAVGRAQISFADALTYFAGQAARDAQLAASASGGIAARHYPPI